MPYVCVCVCVVALIGRSDAVECYSCVSTNYERGDDACLEDSFDEDRAALLANCNCCRVRVSQKTETKLKRGIKK